MQMLSRLVRQIVLSFGVPWDLAQTLSPNLRRFHFGDKERISFRLNTLPSLFSGPSIHQLPPPPCWSLRRKRKMVRMPST
jgi:hypothetical protein